MLLPVAGLFSSPGQFPAPVRTLDALHLASIVYLRENGQSVRLASYYRRMVIAAQAMSITIVDLDDP